MNDGTAFQKRRQLLEMLDQGLVMVHLDPRPDEVIVPGYLKDGPVLRLNLAYGFRLPALDVNGDGVYAVLSFNRQNFGCNLPWSAIFALTAPDKGNDGMVWPSSLPVELRSTDEPPSTTGIRLTSRVQPTLVAVSEPEADEAPTTATRPLDAGEGDERPAPPPLFKVHSGGSSEPAENGAPDEPDLAPPPEKKRSHLRLVKG